MTMSWQRGLALAVVLTMTASASAQGPKKDFKKSPDAGNRGTAEVDRARAEVRELEGQIDRLRQRIDDASRKLDRMQAAAKPKVQDKDRSDFRGPPGGWMKGGPMGGGMARDGFGDMGRGGPPQRSDLRFALGTGGRGPATMSFGRPDVQPKRDVFVPNPRFDQRAGGMSRSPSSDLEARVTRLEHSVDELRREIRFRR